MLERLEAIRRAAHAMHVPVASPEVSALIHLLSGIVRPSYILEIGTATGHTSILLCDTLAESGRIDTIEKDDNLTAIAMDNINKAGLDNIITVLNGDALDILDCLPQRYDIVFLDAAKSLYPSLLPGCIRVLKPGGVLITDNVLFRGMVDGTDPVPRKNRTIVTRLREYMDMLLTDNKLETVIFRTGDGVAVSLKLHVDM